MTTQNAMSNYATSNTNNTNNNTKMATTTVKHAHDQNQRRGGGQMDSLLSLADMDFFLDVFGTSSSPSVLPPAPAAAAAAAGMPVQQQQQRQYPAARHQAGRRSINTSAIAESVLMEINDDIFSDDFLPAAQPPNTGLVTLNSSSSGLMDMDGMNFAPDELEPTPIAVMTRKHMLYNSSAANAQPASPQWLVTPQQQFQANHSNSNSYSVAGAVKRENPTVNNDAFLFAKRRRVSPSLSPRPAMMVSSSSNTMPFMGLSPPAITNNHVGMPQQLVEQNNSKAGGEQVTRFRGYQEDQWNAQYQELCDFIGVNGHCQVPHRTSDKESLSRWCKRQRYQYKLMHEGKPSTMTHERIASLNTINFVWDSHGAIWEERIQELKEYRQLHGHCSIPSNYPTNQKLATWVKCQRRQYKLFQSGKKSNMTMERIVRLNQLGFIWELRSHPTAD